jgi:hypothetical protein
MFFYKVLEFDHEQLITEQLLVLVQELNPEGVFTIRFDSDMIKQRVPLLHEQFQQMGLELDVFREFRSPPYAGAPIHKDGTAQYPKRLAINWPVENCAGTRMIWWDIQDHDPAWFSYENIDPTFGHDVPFFSERDCKEIASVEVLRPMLLNVEVHHSVENLTNKHRRMISFRFKDDPFHLLA